MRANVRELFKWLFPIRYWFHRRVSGADALPYASWERLIRSCNYTVWSVVSLWLMSPWRRLGWAIRRAQATLAETIRNACGD